MDDNCIRLKCSNVLTLDDQMSQMKKIPIILIYSRIVIAVIIAVLAYLHIPGSRTAIVILIVAGLLTDVFDGIVARRLNISTEKLRTMDSNVDQFFWIVTIVSVFYMNLDFFLNHYLWVIAVTLLEVIGYLISIVRFRRTVATHSILAKIWTLTLFIFLIDLVLNTHSFFFFFTCIGLGILSRCEIIIILLKLKKWTTDVPSVFSVSRINEGKTVRKSKWFNS